MDVSDVSAMLSHEAGVFDSSKTNDHTITILRDAVDLTA